MMAQNAANNIEVPDTPKVIQQLTMSHYDINAGDEWIILVKETRATIVNDSQTAIAQYIQKGKYDDRQNVV